MLWRGVQNIIKRAIKIIFQKNGNLGNNQITVIEQKQTNKTTSYLFPPVNNNIWIS